MYSVVGSDGGVYGPVDMATLTRWIAEGRITRDTELIDPLDGHRLPAHMAPALLDAFDGVRPSVPSPAAPYPPAGYPPTPYGYPRPDMMPYAGPPKSKVVAILLAIFLGGFGVHRFYLGHTGAGIGMVALFVAGFVACGLPWIALGVWSLVDIVLIATGGLREANGRELGA